MYDEKYFLFIPYLMILAVDALRYVSFVSILSIFVTVGVVFYEFAAHPVVDPTVEIWHITSRYLLALPIMCVSFNCHYNVPRYYYVFLHMLYLLLGIERSLTWSYVDDFHWCYLYYSICLFSCFMYSSLVY